MAVQNTEACQPQQSLQTSKCIHEAWTETETRDRKLKREHGRGFASCNQMHDHGRDACVTSFMAFVSDGEANKVKIIVKKRVFPSGRLCVSHTFRT